MQPDGRYPGPLRPPPFRQAFKRRPQRNQHRPEHRGVKRMASVRHPLGPSADLTVIAGGALSPPRVSTSYCSGALQRSRSRNWVGETRKMAVRQGFEPWEEFPPHRFSKPAPSASRPPHRDEMVEPSDRSRATYDSAGPTFPQHRLRPLQSGRRREPHAHDEAHRQTRASLLNRFPLKGRSPI